MTTHLITLNFTEKEATFFKLILTYALGNFDMQDPQPNGHFYSRNSFVSILENVSKSNEFMLTSAGSDIKSLEYIVSNFLSYPAIDKEEARKNSIIGDGLLGLRYLISANKATSDSIIKKIKDAQPELASFIG